MNTYCCQSMRVLKWYWDQIQIKLEWESGAILARVAATIK